MTPRTTRLVEWEGALPVLGDYLQTARGTTYLVLACKPNTRPGAKSVARLDILRLAPAEIDEIPADATVHGFRWL